MNGAAAVPDRKISAPMMSRTRIIGVNHHFLLCPQKIDQLGDESWGVAACALDERRAHHHSGSLVTVASIGVSPDLIVG